MEAASCHRVSPIYSNIDQPWILSTLFLLYVDRLSLQATYGSFTNFILMNQLAEIIAWWLIYRISFYGIDFKFAPT